MSTLVPTPPAPKCAAPETPRIISIFFAYDNIAAALWATEALDSFRPVLPDGSEPTLSPWSFATLEGAAHRAEAMEAAVQADLIVVAISNGIKRLPVSVESWLRKCLAARKKTKTTIAAVFGTKGTPDEEDSPRLQTIQRLAREADCEFFTPSARRCQMTAEPTFGSRLGLNPAPPIETKIQAAHAQQRALQ